MRHILFVLSILLILGSGCGKKKKEQQALQEKHRKDSIARVDSIKKVKALKLKKQKEEQARKDSIKKAEEERRKLYKFHIIVGSFKTPKYAIAYNDFIGKKGYQTEMLTNRYNFQMVSIGAYKSWGDAVKELGKVREAIEPTSWIYIREN